MKGSLRKAALRTVASELPVNWRLRGGGIKPGIADLSAADTEKVHYIPALELSWPVQWVHIACGEKVIDEVLDASQPADPV